MNTIRYLMLVALVSLTPALALAQDETAVADTAAANTAAADTAVDELSAAGVDTGASAPPAEPVTEVEAAPTPAAPEDQHVLSLGLKAGAVFPQLSSTFGTTFAVLGGVGYRLPFLGSRFGLVLDLGYSQPTATGEGEDPRIGGSYSWEAVQRQLIFDLGVIARLNEEQSDWNLGLTAGPQLLLLFTTVKGEGGGEPFGEHFEPASSMGLFVAGQGEYRLGPGALLGEINFSTSFQNLRSTGELAVVSVTGLLGYRFDFAF